MVNGIIYIKNLKNKKKKIKHKVNFVFERDVLLVGTIFSTLV